MRDAIYAAAYADAWQRLRMLPARFVDIDGQPHAKQPVMHTPSTLHEACDAVGRACAETWEAHA